MKYFILFEILLLCSCTFIKPEKQFNFTDEKLKKKSLKIVPKPVYLYDPINYPKNDLKYLDSLIVFLKKNPSLYIEVGVFSDYRGTAKYNNLLTNRQAKKIGEYLINNGIDSNQFCAIGYGEFKAINSQKKINKIKDQQIINMMHNQNERIVIKILKTCK